ncbi:MAG TPA: MaoC/PaaZ C-terminal domain-containing protein [Ktedonobacterales bacterium]
MPLDPSLVGREMQPLTGLVTADDIRHFAGAIGDTNPIFHDPAAAELAGFSGLPATPTFVTRFHISFDEAGLDPEHSQVLHAEQEYEYERPLYAADTFTGRYRVASIRQSGRTGGMAIMGIELQGDVAGERVVTGRSTLIVRDAPAQGAAAGAAASASKPAKPTQEPDGKAIPSLTKHITQQQIDAYADVSGDHNPIHINPEAARAVGLDGTIAHGMLSMAFLGQMLTDWLSEQGASSGWVRRLRARFQAMVRPGDTLTCHGVLGELGEQGQRIEVWIDNQHSERIITGDADVVLAS